MRYEMGWGGHPVIEAKMLALVKRLADLPDGDTFGSPLNMERGDGIAFYAIVAFGYVEQCGPRVHITEKGREWLQRQSSEA